MQHEGGYVNDPVDPGGETNYGISKRAHPEVDIKALTKEKAAEIYFHQYWLPYAADWDWPFCLCMLDTVVNCGPKGLNRILQDFARANDQTPNEFLNARIAYYLALIERNSKLGKFKKGWLNRVNDLKKYIDLTTE